MKLLILGIDPGTTVGIAILDLKGNILALKSKKEFSLNEIISFISKHGKPLLIGCDKKNSPSFVDKVAAKTGSKVIPPLYDLEIKKKKELTKKYEYNNDHERDALASAFFAYKKFRNLLDRIDKYIIKNNLEEIRHALTSKVVHENKSIAKSLELIKYVPELKEPKKPKNPPSDPKYTHFKEKIEQLNYENQKLQNKISHSKTKISKLNRKIENYSPTEHYNNIIENKDRKISTLQNALNKKQEELNLKSHTINKITQILENLETYTILKKFKNLGLKEYSKHKIIEGDLVYIENPYEYSPKVINDLKSKVDVIFTKSKNKFDLILIDISKVKFQEFDKFIFIKKSDFKKLKNISLMKDLIIKYKQEITTN